MAAPAVLRSSGPALCPSFAEVCSFLERYGAALDLPEMTFPQMESYMRDTTTGERLAALLLGRRSGEKLRQLKPKEYIATTITIIPIVMRMKMTLNVDCLAVNIWWEFNQRAFSRAFLLTTRFSMKGDQMLSKFLRKHLEREPNVKRHHRANPSPNSTYDANVCYMFVLY